MVYWTNEELNNLYQDTDIVIDIMIKDSNGWVIQIRMENNRIPKDVLHAKLEGKRKVGDKS
jgi:hypothetical protein